MSSPGECNNIDGCKPFVGDRDNNPTTIEITTVKESIDPNTKVIFLYFSMSFCGPCSEFTPLLAAIY